ncbi:hypothetical protein ACP4OV_023344 [Aristida adscensionis]
MAIRIRGGGGGGLAPPRRTRGGAASAYLAAPPPPPPRIRGGGAVLAAAAANGTRGPILFPRVRRALRCAPDPPREEEEEGNGAAWEALKAMVADMFRPIVRNLTDIQSLRSVYDLEDYHLGMIFGAVLSCIGCYQLWKAAPSVFINVVLAYAFYILSVASAEVRRQGKRNDLLTRLKFDSGHQLIFSLPPFPWLNELGKSPYSLDVFHCCTHWHGLGMPIKDSCITLMVDIERPTEESDQHQGIVVIMAIKEFRKDYGALDILRDASFHSLYGYIPFRYNPSEEICETLSDPYR